MAIFRGVGGSGDSSDNSFLQEVTAQANAAEQSKLGAQNALTFAISSASAAQASANSILTLTAATGDAGTDASYNASTGVLTVPRGADGAKLDGLGKFSFGNPHNIPVQTTATVTLIESSIPAAGTEVGQYLTASFSYKVRNSTTTTQKNFIYQIRSEMKSKNTTGVSLGTGTYVSSPSQFHGWYYVSGNKTHIISAGRGKVGTSSGGANSGVLIGSYYDGANDRTYIRVYKYPDYNTVYNNVEIFYSVDSFTSLNTWVVQNTSYNSRYVSLVGSASETKHITINDFFGRHSTATTFRIQVDNLSSVSGWDLDVYDLNGTVENAL